MPRKGYKHTEEAKQKMSLTHIGRHFTEEHKQKLGLAQTGRCHSEETKQKMSLVAKKRWQDLANRGKQSLVTKKLWQNPVYVARMRKNLLPNKAEIHLQKLLDTWYPYEWKFVGDGKLVIDGLCPDFVCINGRKQLVELFGEPWHKDKDSQERIDRFAKFGFYCLIIWSNELKNEAILHTKVKSFVDSYPYKVGLAHQCYYLLKRFGLRLRKTEYPDGESTISARMRRLWQDPVYRQKQSLVQTGKHHCRHTEEHKRKISLANIGKHRTEESKQKMSLAKIGTHHTEETRQKLSLASKKLWQDPIYRQKESLARIGKHHTKETRQKMSIAQKARWANEREGSAKINKRILVEETGVNV